MFTVSFFEYEEVGVGRDGGVEACASAVDFAMLGIYVDVFVD